MSDNDCIQCGNSDLVRAGNSYYTCPQCVRSNQVQPKSAKFKSSGTQATLSSHGAIVRQSRDKPEDPS